MLTIGILLLILYSSNINKYENYKNQSFKDLIKLTSLIIIYSLFLLFNTNKIKIKNILLFNDQFEITNYIIIIIALLFLLLFIYIILINYYINFYINNHKVKEILLLLLFNILSLSLFMCSFTTLALFITIEFQSYIGYLITGLFHKEKKNKTDISGSLTVKVSLLYFIIGTLASIIFLLGITIIYQKTGLINLSDLSAYLTTITNYNLEIKNEIYFGYIITIIGLLIKIGSGPLHSWLINIYIKSPTIITGWISIVGKITLLTVIQIIIWTLWDGNLTISSPIIKLITIIMTISLIIGSLGGLIQTNVKSIIAYSGILNTGYLLMTIIPSTPYALSAYLFYIIQYSLTHLTWFILLTLTIIKYKNLTPNISNELNLNLISTNITYLKDLYQLIIKDKLLTLGYIITITSFIGLPPLAGFYGKLHILESTLLSSNLLNVIILIFVSGISTIYYAYIIQTLVWSENKHLLINNNNNNLINLNNNSNNIGISIYIILTILLIILIYPLPIYEITIKGVEIIEQTRWI